MKCRTYNATNLYTRIIADTHSYFLKTQKMNSCKNKFFKQTYQNNENHSIAQNSNEIPQKKRKT
jgi:hypothetical protein